MKTGNEEYTVGDSLTITQYRSAAGRDGIFRGTLCSMGLGRIGHTTTLKLDKPLWGKIERVLSVIKIEKKK